MAMKFDRELIEKKSEKLVTKSFGQVYRFRT